MDFCDIFVEMFRRVWREWSREAQRGLAVHADTHTILSHILESILQTTHDTNPPPPFYIQTSISFEVAEASAAAESGSDTHTDVLDECVRMCNTVSNNLATPSPPWSEDMWPRTDGISGAVIAESVCCVVQDVIRLLESGDFASDPVQSLAHTTRVIISNTLGEHFANLADHCVTLAARSSNEISTALSHFSRAHEIPNPDEYREAVWGLSPSTDNILQLTRLARGLPVCSPDEYREFVEVFERGDTEFAQSVAHGVTPLLSHTLKLDGHTHYTLATQVPHELTHIPFTSESPESSEFVNPFASGEGIYDCKVAQENTHSTFANLLQMDSTLIEHIATLFAEDSRTPWPLLESLPAPLSGEIREVRGSTLDIDGLGRTSVVVSRGRVFISVSLPNRPAAVTTEGIGMDDSESEELLRGGGYCLLRESELDSLQDDTFLVPLDILDNLSGEVLLPVYLISGDFERYPDVDENEVSDVFGDVEESGGRVACALTHRRLPCSPFLPKTLSPDSTNYATLSSISCQIVVGRLVELKTPEINTGDISRNILSSLMNFLADHITNNTPHVFPARLNSTHTSLYSLATSGNQRSHIFYLQLLQSMSWTSTDSAILLSTLLDILGLDPSDIF